MWHVTIHVFLVHFTHIRRILTQIYSLFLCKNCVNQCMNLQIEHTNKFYRDNQSWQGIWITVWINQFVRGNIKISCWYVSLRCCEIQQTQSSENIYSVAVEIRQCEPNQSQSFICDIFSEKITLSLKLLWNIWFNILLANSKLASK